MQFVPHDISIDFVGKRQIAAISSGLLVITSIILFVVVGPNWGIDFTGGTEIHLKFNDPIEIGDIRSAIASVGLPDDAVQQIGAPDSGEYNVRVQDAAFGSEDVRRDVERTLRETFGQDWIEEIRFEAQVGARMTIVYNGPALPLEKIRTCLKGFDEVVVQEATDDNTFYAKLPGLSALVEKAIEGSLVGHDFQVLQVDSVGPRVGGDLRRQGFVAIAAMLGLVLVYVAFRFDLAFAPGAVLALFHDVMITIGIFVLLHREVNLPIVGALLTIIGYSLNDTIVIYDRIRENMGRYRRYDMAKLINDSVNETLNRTINTSLTTFVAVLFFLFMGGPVIETFAMAMLIGVVVGTYSTVFVASPMILVMQDVKPALLKLMKPTTNRGSPEQAAARALDRPSALRYGQKGAGGGTVSPAGALPRQPSSTGKGLRTKGFKKKPGESR